MVALALGGFVYSLNQQRQADFAAQSRRSPAERTDERPRRQDLHGHPDGAQYTFVVSKQRNAALFIGTDLANPGADKTYPAVDAAGPEGLPRRPGCRLGEPSGSTGPITESTSLAISIEPAGGAQQPTPPILAQVTI